MRRPLPVLHTSKADLMAAWLTSEWMPQHPEPERIIFAVDTMLTNNSLLKLVAPDFTTRQGYRFTGYSEFDCPVTQPLNQHSPAAEITQRAGAFLLNFAASNGESVAVPVLTSVTDDGGWHTTSVASVPVSFLLDWTMFTNECHRLLNALTPSDRVVILGGRAGSFQPVVAWDDVILPPALKTEILSDVRSFFESGVSVYKRLKLKPFRKMLLAGVPGTGKTMLCSALAKWAIEHQYLVIYVSSALHGAQFHNIHEALEVASQSKYPAIILLEELDAYLKAADKALILNVLDGAEAPYNDRGTLLVATTNYPEAIDERVLKRPGRLDRVFIIPEVQSTTDAESMLKSYLGTAWEEAHRAIVPGLIGYPGAFIREVAISAMIRMINDKHESLPLETLEQCFAQMKEQIDVRDEFLKRRNGKTAPVEA